jgi:glucan phosphoethanolaminetransferase (alkaline phosphatase superfamily)
MTNGLTKKPTERKDKRALFSTLWIFLTVNYIFCDVFSNMEPGALKELVTTGGLSGIQLTQGFLLLAAISMEIPMVMIVLSRVLKYKANRWANIIIGILMTVYQISTMNVGTAPTLHYIFFSTIEIACNLLIVWLAWKWINPEE